MTIRRKTLLRLRAFVVILGMVLGMVTGVAGTALAGTGDNYPEPWHSAAKDSQVDSWGYYNRECTSWVAWALHDRNGFEMPHAIGNGAQWGVWASDPAHQFPVNGTPAVGAVAWWAANTMDQGYNVGSAGHVAWVSAVSGSTVTIEEYNYNSNGLWHTRTMAASNAQYIHFADTGGGNNSTRSAITSAINADGRIELYAVGGDGNIYAKSQVAAGGAFSSNWNTIPAGARDVATAVDTDGRIELFHVGNDGAVWERSQTSPNGNFGGEQSLGGNIRPAITAARNADGRVELYVVGGDGNIYAKSQTTPNGVFGTSWNAIAANAVDIASAVSIDGRVELFYINADGSLRHRAQTTQNGNFGNEDNYGGNVRGPLAAARNADGRLEAYAVGGDGNIYAKSQTTPNGVFSTSWNAIPSGAQDVTASVNTDGRIALLHIGNDRAAWVRTQTGPNGNFGDEVYLGGGLR